MIENIRETSIPGCFELKVRVQRDDRGSFTKIFHEGIFAEYNLDTCFKEEFYSVSRKGVLRGLHFQLPPEDHAKLVCCLCGAVLDAVVDLRKGSPSYGKNVTFELNGEDGTVIYIPPGVAHGFYVTGPEALILYNTTKIYNAQCDSGILWNSAGISWPEEEPLISEKDKKMVPLAAFKSPFEFALKSFQHI